MSLLIAMHYVIFVNLPILAVRLLLKAKYFQFPQAVYRMYSARLKVVADDVDFPLSEMEHLGVYFLLSSKPQCRQTVSHTTQITTASFSRLLIYSVVSCCS